jgi:hypothetical protein
VPRGAAFAALKAVFGGATKLVFKPIDLDTVALETLPTALGVRQDDFL